jgi:hypothetical protein
MRASDLILLFLTKRLQDDSVNVPQPQIKRKIFSQQQHAKLKEKKKNRMKKERKKLGRSFQKNVFSYVFAFGMKKPDNDAAMKDRSVLLLHNDYNTSSW